MTSLVQHELAHKVLSTIGKSPERRRLFTYRSLSQELRRPKPDNDSRAMAQVCDLLDAAAAIAGVPLYALVRVRNVKGEINPMAWGSKKVPAWVRPAVIRRSETHEFSTADIAAIKVGLGKLEGFGNRSAWKEVRARVGGYTRLFQLITEPPIADQNRDAIDDLGSDTPARKTTMTNSFQRDEAVRQRVLEIAKGRCEYCRKLGFLKADGTRYLETHHIIALASDGADRVGNVVALCATHHREAHFGADCERLEQRLTEIAQSKERLLGLTSETYVPFVENASSART